MSEHEPGGGSPEKKSAMEEQLDKKTGISHDFRNEFSAIMSTIYTLDNDPNLAEKLFKGVIRSNLRKGGRLMLKYEERCQNQGFDPATAVNDANRDGVTKLNELVDECNNYFTTVDGDASLSTLDKLNALKNNLVPKIAEMEKIIRG